MNYKCQISEAVSLITLPNGNKIMFCYDNIFMLHWHDVFTLH